jgi:hypothetical protein
LIGRARTVYAESLSLTVGSVLAGLDGPAEEEAEADPAIVLPEGGFGGGRILAENREKESKSSTYQP